MSIASVERSSLRPQRDQHRPFRYLFENVE